MPNKLKSPTTRRFSAYYRSLIDLSGDTVLYFLRKCFFPDGFWLMRALS
jgi:uncharacterized protein (DUF3820 family)